MPCISAAAAATVLQKQGRVWESCHIRLRIHIFLKNSCESCFQSPPKIKVNNWKGFQLRNFKHSQWSHENKQCVPVNRGKCICLTERVVARDALTSSLRFSVCSWPSASKSKSRLARGHRVCSFSPQALSFLLLCKGPCADGGSDCKWRVLQRWQHMCVCRAPRPHPSTTKSSDGQQCATTSKRQGLPKHHSGAFLDVNFF